MAMARSGYSLITALVTCTTDPHHKHAGSGDTVIESTAPDFADILKEIEPFLPLS